MFLHRKKGRERKLGKETLNMKVVEKAKEMFNGAKAKLASAAVVGSAVLLPAVCNAEGPTTGSTTTTPSLDIAFDVAECFSWAQTIISAMLPVVYITMGVSLGFLIIRAFKSAFNG